MKTEGFLSLVTAVAAAVTGVFFVLAPENPRTVVTSADGWVAMDAPLRSVITYTVRSAGDIAAGAPLLGTPYMLGPQGVVLPSVAHVTMRGAGWPGQVAAYTYINASRMWEKVPVTQDGGKITFSTDRLGVFAPGEDMQVTLPSVQSSVAALRERAPLKTVGYDMAVGYVLPESGAVIRIPGAGEVGGCGGRPTAGDATAYSQLAVPVTATVNGVARKLDAVIIARFNLSATAGCTASLPLQPVRPL